MPIKGKRKPQVPNDDKLRRWMVESRKCHGCFAVTYTPSITRNLQISIG